MSSDGAVGADEPDGSCVESENCPARSAPTSGASLAWRGVSVGTRSVGDDGVAGEWASRWAFPLAFSDGTCDALRTSSSLVVPCFSAKRSK